MLSGRNYIVLGAAGGIGSQVCRRLHAAGARLLLAGRTAEPLGQLGRELDAPHHVANATVIDEVEKCFEEAVQTLGSVDGVVNAVGSLLLKPAHLTTAAEWEQTLAANLTSAFAAVRAGARVMKEGGGSIVLVSSAAAQTGLPNHEAIAAAKAGVIGLMRSAAATYAARRIRVNAVAPGLIQTPLTQRIWSQPKSAEASRSLHALGRLGTPDDVAALIVWLLDPANDWITGQVIGVDGGLAELRVPPAAR
ncbi:MAG: SDR family oxidoreductase [Pirellulaceae bacterium]|jgi:NAD(P)-dependent dehydrogenase (short-subunit alcohol dehydrogenase family)|nr:SDR family oxidoreductase [Pirellulaceae bacterium]